MFGSGSSGMIMTVLRQFLKIIWFTFLFYLITNVIGFFLAYMRVSSASYALQQKAMENNFIPEEEMEAFQMHLNNLKSAYVQDLHIVVYTDKGPGETGAFWRKDEDEVPVDYTDYSVFFKDNVNERVQYGHTIYVGVACDFRALFPFLYNETIKSGKVAGNNGSGSDFLSDEELKRSRKYTVGHIDIVEPVIGLRYYSDLEN